LNNLGIRYSEVGRRQEAVGPVEEAVALWRGLAEQNAVFVPDLAMALNNLRDRYSEVGRDREYDDRWHECLRSVAEPHHPYLYFRRAAAAIAGDHPAIGWLHTALAGVIEDRGLVAVLHEQARRHRVPDPDSFDDAWEKLSGAPVPDWLTVDPSLVDTAEGWISTDTYTAEKGWLAAHPELLEPAADTAVDEALLVLRDDEAERYRGIREVARAEGVAAAYRPTELRILASRFAEADRDEQRSLLAEEGENLRDDIVDVYLAERADDDPQALVAQCLIGLSRTGVHDRVLDALGASESMRTLLADLARGADSLDLALTATVAGIWAPDDTDTALAMFYLGIAHAMSGDRDQATEWMAQARAIAPDQVNAWINELASVGATNPNVLPLIAVLTAPTEENDA